MTQLYAFIAAHQVIFSLASYWIFSAAVSAMPAPTPTSTATYLWLYQFLHLISANLDKYVQAKGGTTPVEAKEPDGPKG